MLIEREATAPPLSISARPARRPAAGADHRREPAPHRRALRRPRGAGRARPGLPRDLPRALGRGRRSPPAACSPAACAPATAWASGRPTATSGSSSSTPPRASARSSSPSTRPTRRPSCEYALTKTGVSLLVLARGFRQADYVAMLEEVRAALPAAARDARARGRLGRSCSPTASAWPRPTWPRSRRRCTPTTRSTSSSPRAPPAPPRAPRSRTTTSSTTATSPG